MKRKLADCLVFTVRVSIPIKPMEPATIEAANRAIEELEGKLPPGAVVEIVRAPTFGKCAVRDEKLPSAEDVRGILFAPTFNRVPASEPQQHCEPNIPEHLDRRVPRL